MHTLRHDLGASPIPSPALAVEIVIPAYNEERVLATSVYRLHRYLSLTLPYSWQITIADNASTDLTRRSPARWPPSSRTYTCSASSKRGAAVRCARPGPPAAPRWSRTWTSICRPTFERCFR
jgi:hypothetical protein